VVFYLCKGLNIKKAETVYPRPSDVIMMKTKSKPKIKKAKSVMRKVVSSKARVSKPTMKPIAKAAPKPAPMKKPDAKERKAIERKEEAALKKISSGGVITRILGSDQVSSYITQNVSKRALEVISLLDEPRTDEQIAALLDMKINTARRVLNILQGYGVTNYMTKKDDKGWLSFFWYINTGKIDQFFEYIRKNNAGAVLANNCNDYFICKSCYEENKLVFNFDSAYEVSFKCNCNSTFTRVDRSFVENALAQEASRAEATTTATTL
jgi:transcription initiation factor IIE alpha subunit